MPLNFKNRTSSQPAAAAPDLLRERREKERRWECVVVPFERRSNSRRDGVAASTLGGGHAHGDAEAFKEAYHFLRKLVFETINIGEFSKLSKAEMRGSILEVSEIALSGKDFVLTIKEKNDLIKRVTDDVTEYGPLTAMLGNPEITDIMVNGPKDIWIERKGTIEKSDIVFDNTAHLMSVIARLASSISRHVDESSPMLDARLPDGSRVNIVLPPLAVRGPSISIRKFPSSGYTIADLAGLGAMPVEVGEMLSAYVRERKNVLVSGGTGCGKTTLMGAMAQNIGGKERVVTIEDTAELKMTQPNWVALECRPANTEGLGEVVMSQLLRNSLRMRPDRIIIGEVRGDEAGELLQAMNTGHEGCMGTVHANTPGDAVQRFENMICINGRYPPGLATRRQIVSVLDVIVQMGRDRKGKRYISRVAEVVGLDGESIILRDVYAAEANGETTGAEASQPPPPPQETRQTQTQYGNEGVF